MREATNNNPDDPSGGAASVHEAITNDPNDLSGEVIMPEVETEPQASETPQPASPAPPRFHTPPPTNEMENEVYDVKNVRKLHQCLIVAMNELENIHRTHARLTRAVRRHVAGRHVRPDSAVALQWMSDRSGPVEFDVFHPRHTRTPSFADVVRQAEVDRSWLWDFEET